MIHAVRTDTKRATPFQRESLSVVAVISWLFAMAFSLVASPNYLGPVSLAVIFASVHFIAVSVLLRRSQSVLRFAWLLLSLPLGIFTFDNLGRLSGILDGPLIRLLI